MRGLQKAPEKMVGSILLVMVVILSLTSTSSANSQTLETVTTLLTSTSFGYTILATRQVTSTITGELSQAITLPPQYRTTTGCATQILTVTVQEPQHLSGNLTVLTASYPVNFYLMTKESYEKWAPLKPCTVQVDTLITKIAVLFYGFDIDVSPGDYVFLFMNDADFAANVDFSVNAGQTTTTFAEPITSALTQVFVVTSRLQAAQVIQPFSLGQNSLLILAGLGSVVLIVPVLVLKKRRKTVGTMAVAQPQAGPEVPTLNTPLAGPSSEPTISTGYRELDSMLEGGIPDGYAVVILSSSFDEKDLLLRRTIASSLKSGRPTFYLSNDIAKTRDLINKFSQNFYALNPFADKITTDRVNLFKIPDVGDLSNLSISSNEIIESKATNEVSKMLVIDLLSDLLMRNKARTTRRWLTDFTAKRKANGFTILATLDPLTAPQEEIQMIIGVFDGIIEIYEKPLQERSRRFLVIKKMYGRSYSENELMLDKQSLL